MGLAPGTATSAAVTVPFSSTTKLAVSPHVGFSWQRITAKITVTGGSQPPVGTVTVKVNGKPVDVALAADANGKLTYTLPKLKAGIYTVTASFGGSATVAASKSSTELIWIVF